MIEASIPHRSLDQKLFHFPKAVAVTFVTRLVILAGALGTSVTVGRWLGAEGLGSLAVINVTVALGVQFGCFGLPSANTYFISRNPNDLAKLWSNSFLFALIAGAVVAALIIFAALVRPTAFGQVSPVLLTIAAASIPFQLLILLGLNAFLAVGQINRLNITEAAWQIALLVNTALTLALFGRGLLTLVSFNTIVAFAIAVIIVLAIRSIVKKTGAESPWFDLATFRKTVRYGVKFYISILAGIVIVRADLLLVNHFRTAAEAGVYAVAGQMANLFLLLPAVIATLLFPRIASDPDPQAQLAMRVTRHTAFIMLLVCLAAVPFSFLLPWVYGAAFEDSTLQLLILLPGVYLYAIESVMVQHFTGVGLPLAIPLFWIVVVTCNLTLNFVFIPTYGATAAAIISSFTYALIFLLVAIYFRVKTGNNLLSALVMQREEMRALIRPSRLTLFSE